MNDENYIYIYIYIFIYIYSRLASNVRCLVQFELTFKINER